MILEKTCRTEKVEDYHFVLCFIESLTEAWEEGYIIIRDAYICTLPKGIYRVQDTESNKLQQQGYEDKKLENGNRKQPPLSGRCHFLCWSKSLQANMQVGKMNGA